MRFVNVVNPQSETQDITITNVGGPTAAPLTVTFALSPGSTPDYSVFDQDTGDPLAGGRCGMPSPPASCMTPLVIPNTSSEIISVTYAPVAEPATALLRISSNDPDPDDSPIEIDLIGSGGAGNLQADVAQLVWDNPAIDTPETLSVVFTNDGNADEYQNQVDLDAAVRGVARIGRRLICCCSGYCLTSACGWNE